MLKCTFVGEFLTALIPLSADIDKRSNAEADDGTLRRRGGGRLRRTDRAELNLFYHFCCLTYKYTIQLLYWPKINF